MTSPAISLKRHRTSDHAFHRVQMTADAIFLYNTDCLRVGPDGCGVAKRRKGIYIPYPGFTLVNPVSKEIVMRDMAISACCPADMWGMEPILVLRIHYVAVIAGLRGMTGVRRGVRSPGEYAQSDDKCQDSYQERPVGGVVIIHLNVTVVLLIYINFKQKLVTLVTLDHLQY
jgi:hypothetical protein